MGSRGWGSWALALSFVAVHFGSAIAFASRANTGVLEALVFERTATFRVMAGGQYAPLVDAGQVWRLVRSVWLHADLGHVLVNAVAVGMVGRLVEGWVGPSRILVWFVLGGMVGSVASHGAGLVQSDGASGGAFALLGAVWVLGWRVKQRLDSRDRQVVLRWIPLLIGLNLVLSVVLPFVDGVAHVAGLGVGMGLGAVVSPSRPSRGIQGVEIVCVVIAVAIAATGPYWPS